MNYLNTFIKAKNLDKQMVMDYLGGKDPRKVYPLYHAPLVPTFAGSLDIFELTQEDQGRDSAESKWTVCSDCAAV